MIKSPTLSRSYAEVNPLTLVRMMIVALGSRIQAFPLKPHSDGYSRSNGSVEQT